MTFLRARYYQPETGRFVSLDPWPGMPTSPATLNRFAYVGNRPTVLVDPSGMYPPEPGPNIPQPKPGVIDALTMAGFALDGFGIYGTAEDITGRSPFIQGLSAQIKLMKLTPGLLACCLLKEEDYSWSQEDISRFENYLTRMVQSLGNITRANGGQLLDKMLTRVWYVFRSRIRFGEGARGMLGGRTAPTANGALTVFYGSPLWHLSGQGEMDTVAHEFGHVWDLMRNTGAIPLPQGMPYVPWPRPVEEYQKKMKKAGKDAWEGWPGMFSSVDEAREYGIEEADFYGAQAEAWAGSFANAIMQPGLYGGNPLVDYAKKQIRAYCRSVHLCPVKRGR